MLRFCIQSSIEDKLYLFHKLRKNRDTCQIVREKFEENYIATIHDDNILCGGALIFGKDNPLYLFCFFEKEKYCVERYYNQLRVAIEIVFPKLEVYDVFCLNTHLDSKKMHCGKITLSEHEQIELEPPLSSRQVFSDLLLDYIYQWAKQGFMLDYDWNFSDSLVAISIPYIKCSMEYISSNIMNYADRNRTVRITTTSQENSFYISVQASIGSDRVNDVCIKSNLAPIDIMMKKMKGKCQIQIQEEVFTVTLYFPTL